MIDKFGCVGTAIKTASGKYLDLANPSPDQIDLESIASALSKICRFGGHCPEFYSVAEHSARAVNLAFFDGKGFDLQKAILLHDAAEAYVGDVTKPLKQMLPEFDVIEKRVEKAIEQAFGVDLTEFREEIKHYDMLMLKAEKEYFWPSDDVEWPELDGIELRFVDWRVSQHGHGRAKRRFLRMADDLGIKKKC